MSIQIRRIFLITTLLMLIMIQFLSAQKNFIVITKKDNTKSAVPIDNIDNMTFTEGGFADIDGNVYKTIIINGKEWMAENLRVTRYRNGLSITDVWPADGSEANVDTYGRLYSWYEVNKHVAEGDPGYNIAPEGWHVPTDEEWKELEMYLGMSQSEADGDGVRGTNEGSKLAGRADLWFDGVLENDSEFGASGFTGLPAGWCDSGSFMVLSIVTGFWTASERNINSAWERELGYYGSGVIRGNQDKGYGFSVRCVRD